MHSLKICFKIPQGTSLGLKKKINGNCFESQTVNCIFVDSNLCLTISYGISHNLSL